MKQVTVKRNKHLLLFEIKAPLSPGEIHAISDKITKSAGPEWNLLFTQSQTEITLLTLDEENPA